MTYCDPTLKVSLLHWLCCTFLSCLIYMAIVDLISWIKSVVWPCDKSSSMICIEGPSCIQLLSFQAFGLHMSNGHMTLGMPQTQARICFWVHLTHDSSWYVHVSLSCETQEDAQNGHFTPGLSLEDCIMFAGPGLTEQKRCLLNLNKSLYTKSERGRFSSWSCSSYYFR